MGNVRLSPELKEKVRLMAAVKGLTFSQVYRLALAEYCERELAPLKASRYDDTIGIGDGPHDLSARSEEIFGEVMDEKHRRRREH